MNSIDFSLEEIEDHNIKIEDIKELNYKNMALLYKLLRHILSERLAKVMREVYNVRTSYTDFEQVDGDNFIILDYDNIEVTIGVYSCGEYSYDYYTIPIKALYDSQILKDKIEEDKRKQEEVIRLKKESDERIRKEERRKQYLRLLEEFKDESN